MRFQVSESSILLALPPKTNKTHQILQPVLAILASSIITTATAADTTSTAPSAQTCPQSLIVNLIAYEFPFCLAGKGLLENLFLSRPTDTKLIVNHSDASNPSGGSGCTAINATKGVVHSFFYTADGGGGQSCKLLTYGEKGCEGTPTEYDLGVGFSECFSDKKKFVKPLVASAEVRCG